MSEPFHLGFNNGFHKEIPSQLQLQEVDSLHVSALFAASSNLIGEVCVLEDMTSHLPVIEIRIEECRGEAFWYGSLLVSTHISCVCIGKGSIVKL